MRRPLHACASLLAAAACTSSARDRVALDGGSLVALHEGEKVTRTLAHPAGPRGRTPADWALVDDMTLILTPPCSLVPGTDGPPRLFTLDLDNGDEPVLVQVAPSLEGRCLPRVLACLSEPGAVDACAGPIDPASFAPYQDQSTGMRDDRFLEVAFCSDRPACSSADREVRFKLYDPEDPMALGTSMLFAQLTTDAPIVFARGDATQRFTNQTDPVGALYNAHIAGDFRASYEIASARNVAARITTGAYGLTWSDARPGESARLGIQAASCASASPRGCAVASAPSAPACITPHARPVTIGLRLWIGAMAVPSDATAMHVTARVGDGSLARSVVFTSSSETRTDEIDLRFNSERVLDAAAAVDVGVDADQIVTFSAWACADNAAPTTARKCAAIDGPPDATLALLVKAPSATQCAERSRPSSAAPGS